MKKTTELTGEESYEEDDSNEAPPPDVVAYNELRSCADLFRMSKQGILDLQPDFQRDVVWSATDQTRFVDSLIKQLQIPSMCFSLDYKTQKWLVIDGLQRLSTIVKFLKGTDWKLSKLEDITPQISGKLVSSMKEENTDLHHFYQRVENLTLPITVLRCDYSKKTHMEYLFTIFHRLNSGGMKLKNQEIRNCIYGGVLNLLLRELDTTLSWRKLNRMKKDDNQRLTKQELILRYFAFSERQSKYSGSLSKFLNSYMADYREASPAKIESLRSSFVRVSDFIWNRIFNQVLPSKISITLLEATLVGVGKNISSLELKQDSEIKRMFAALGENPNFNDSLILEGTSKTQRVKDRLAAAERIFSG